MAEFTKRTVTSTRHEYVLKIPTNLAEFNKAAYSAYQDLPPRLQKFDDSIQVDSTDDEIILYWVEGEPTKLRSDHPLQFPTLARGGIFREKSEEKEFTTKNDESDFINSPAEPTNLIDYSKGNQPSKPPFD